MILDQREVLLAAQGGRRGEQFHTFLLLQMALDTYGVHGIGAEGTVCLLSRVSSSELSEQFPCRSGVRETGGCGVYHCGIGIHHQYLIHH